MQRRLLMRNVLDQIELAPLIVLERHIVLGVYSVHLTFSLGVSKQRAQEKLRESVKSLAISFI